MSFTEDIPKICVERFSKGTFGKEWNSENSKKPKDSVRPDNGTGLGRITKELKSLNRRI